MPEQNEPAHSGQATISQAISTFKTGFLPEAMQQAQQALKLLDKNTREYRMGLFLIGNVQMYQGLFAEALQHFSETYANSLDNNDRDFMRDVSLLMGICCVTSGKLHKAYEYYQQTYTFAYEQGKHDIAGIALLGQATIAYEWNQLALAEQHVEAALALESKERDVSDGLALIQAWIASARGQISTVRQLLIALQSRLEAVAVSDALLRQPPMLLLSARLSLVIGDFEKVHQILENPVFEGYPLARIYRAYFYLQEDKHEEARLQLEPLLPVVQERQQAIEIKLVMALAYAAGEELAQAQQWLQQALEQACDEGYMRLFLAQGNKLLRVLRLLIPTLQDAELLTYARTLLHAFLSREGELASDVSVADTLLLEPLSTQERRVLRLLAAGRTDHQIAQELGVSVLATKGRVKQLYQRLKVDGRPLAVITARRLKLI